jgi:two-component system, LuxR family, sensor kinase FixL
MTDLTNDTRAQARLAEARFRLAAIAESSDDAIVGKDLAGIVTAWNKAAETMFGYSAEEIIGQSITRIIPSDRIDEEVAILDRVHAGERIVHFETERRCKDGRIIPVTLTVSPIRDDQNRIVGISKIARDLSEMQNVHRDLKRREGLLRAILDAAPDALVVINKHGLIQSFSAAAERMFGYSPADVVGRNVSMLMPSPYRKGHDGYLAHYLETGERRIIGIGRVVVGQRKDGGQFPMELTVGEVDVLGTQLFAGFVRDLTKRQEREKRVNELQSELLHVSRVAELGQMVAALAHEVNQPLTAITAYLSGVRRLLATDKHDAVPQAMERISEQADRARQIVKRIRDHVNKQETERQVENLLKLIEEACSLALVGVDQGLRLEIRVDETAAEVLVDKIQIQQVLLNLMRNAAEAMEGSTRRELSIEGIRSGDMVRVSVADTGPGLPATVRARLFEPFVTTKTNGMGVGLSVSRTIIEAHGGNLHADDRVDGGTVFHFTIPAVEIPLSARGGAAKPTRGS